MPNPFLSARIPAELDQKINEFLARTGESKTEMLAKAVAAYIGTEVPHLKATGDRRIENLEQEVANLKDAITSLFEKFATLSPKAEHLKIDTELINTTDNSVISSVNDTKEPDTINPIFEDLNTIYNNKHNHLKIEQTNLPDSIVNTDNTDSISLDNLTPTIDDSKKFINIDTAEVARLTKLPYKTINNLRGYINRNLKKENKALPENKILDAPIKVTPQSGIKILKVPYDLFYAGQSNQGKNLWNLIPKGSFNKQLNLLENS
ncbi:hypothetical protein QUA42_27260 [Microcoleus sp. Pol11C2]|uniref:hypothetical protein n=1 Tax=Microcoleus sp. Pol11C2 TaxID=3055389 RepID=UPI002FD07289